MLARGDECDACECCALYSLLGCARANALGAERESGSLAGALVAAKGRTEAQSFIDLGRPAGPLVASYALCEAQSCRL